MVPPLGSAALLSAFASLSMSSGYGSPEAPYSSPSSREPALIGGSWSESPLLGLGRPQRRGEVIKSMTLKAGSTVGIFHGSVALTVVAVIAVASLNRI